MCVCTIRRMLKLELPGGKPKIRFINVAKERHEVSFIR